jgi:hypothetical protein
LDLGSTKNPAYPLASLSSRGVRVSTPRAWGLFPVFAPGGVLPRFVSLIQRCPDHGAVSRRLHHPQHPPFFLPTKHPTPPGPLCGPRKVLGSGAPLSPPSSTVSGPPGVSCGPRASDRGSAHSREALNISCDIAFPPETCHQSRWRSGRKLQEVLHRDRRNCPVCRRIPRS